MDWERVSTIQNIPRRNRWRGIQMTLGQLQVLGSTTAFFLLASQGVTDIVLWIFSGTMAVTLTSIVLFRILKIHEQGQ